MKITVTRAFNDMTLPADVERRREICTVFDVTDERGVQLIALGLAAESETAADAPAAPAAPTALLPGANAAALPTPPAVDHDDAPHS